MTSQKQMAANRGNAAKSTGPKTAEDKQVTRLNALKHGLQAEHVVIPGEDPEEFEALARGLEEHYQPVGSAEDFLVERIANCTWRLQRATLIETAMMRKEHYSLESTRAKNEMKRAGEEISWIQRVFDYDGDEDDLEEDEESDNKHNLPEDEAEALSRRYDKAEEDYKKAREAYDRAEDELKMSSCSFDVVFLRSAYNLEKLSRYETTLERRLRNAMQDLERLQAARKAEAAEAATVIDVTDLNQDED